MAPRLQAVIVALAAVSSASAFSVFPSTTRGVRTWTTRPLRSEVEAAGDDLPAPGDDLSSKISLESLEIDSTIEGVVKGVSDFGAFVDFGGESDGLVHKSQLSDDFVETPSEFVKVGDTVSVRVLRVDLEKNQVSLSMKSKSSGGGGGGRRGGGGGADLSKYEAMAPSEFVTGTVKTIATYGAFVELEGGASGLVHISQLAAGRVETVESVVSQGDEVQVRVLNVRDGKISLAMSPYVEKTAEEIEAEKSRPKRGGGGGDNDQFPGGRKPREERVDDIWSDNTEPKWKELMEESKETMDNVLELKL